MIEIETQDTGEQGQMFGHSARHFVTTERRQTEYAGRPPSQKYEIVTDGWYVELPLSVANHSRIGTFSVVDTHDPRVIPRVKITHSGTVIHGLPVWEKTGEHLMEVIELSEAPLDQSLFEVPSGYRKVIRPQPGVQLPCGDRLLLYWREFQDWLITSF